MRSGIKKELIDMTEGRILFDEPMKNHTTFGIGGPSNGFVYPASKSELITLLKYADTRDIQVYFIGSGSNLLVSDEGFDGIVISLSRTFKELVIRSNGVVTCEAGVMTGTLVKGLVKAGFEGVESLIGVPGTIGGALIMNAGAFGNEISEHLQSVKVLTKKGQEKEVARDVLKFSYRQSSFQKDEIIISAEFKFPVGDPMTIRKKKAEVSRKRKNHQPLRYRSAGSIFKNPQKQSAGYLIEQAGLKGTRSGDAEISTKHANFIVNRGLSTAENVLDLIHLAKSKVKEKFNVDLELEVELLGFTNEILKSYLLV